MNSLLNNFRKLRYYNYLKKHLQVAQEAAMKKSN